jgi:perosamine synthetase
MKTLIPPAREATARLRDCLAGLGAKPPIPLHSPTFTKNDLRYVKDCIDTGWVSSVGSYVDKFEAHCAAAAGTRHAVATVNGTAALHAALHLIGIGPGDAVICPALTFIATANAIAYTGAKPIFLDSAWDTLGLDPAALREFTTSACDRRGNELFHVATGLRISVAIAVHIFGHPAEMATLNEVCDTVGIALIEDSTEAVGSLYRGHLCGGLTKLGTFSFNGNKLITTGGGGAITTDDDALAARLKHLTTTARVSHDWNYDHDMVGFNYRLPNLNAALGCSQFERFPAMLEQKRQLHARYHGAFENLPGVRLFTERDDCRSNHWLNALIFDDPAEAQTFLNETNDAGISTRPCWRLMPDTGAYAGRSVSGAIPVARDIAARLVNIPSSPWLMSPPQKIGSSAPRSRARRAGTPR